MNELIGIPEIDPRERSVNREDYCDYRLERTCKPPLRFRGKWLNSSWGFKELDGIGLTEGSITVYETPGSNFVAEIHLFRGTTTQEHTLTFAAKSRKALAKLIARELKDGEFLQTLFPDDPDYYETID
jgi:hypothetical protein